jgi:hypothetical protein
MWALLGRLIGFAAQRLGTGLAGAISVRTVATAVGAGLAGVSLEELRDQAALHAGATGSQGLEEAARTAARMLGLGGDQVLWPVNRRTGALIPPIYFTIDLVRGRAWYHSRYTSSRRRYGRSFGRGRFRKWLYNAGPGATINNNAG